MDHFNVPKKVNRHVLKALGILSDGNRDQVVVTTQIIDQVKHQMRNLVPVPNLDSAVEKSLKNLSEIGLIDRHGTYRYALGRCAAVIPGPSAQPKSRTPDRRVFRGNVRTLVNFVLYIQQCTIILLLPLRIHDVVVVAI